MAGKKKNQEWGLRGQVINLDVEFFATYGGPLVDPNPFPSFTIYDPTNALAYSGTPQKVAVGQYVAQFPIPQSAMISDEWKIVWNATVNNVPVNNVVEYFRVVEEQPSPLAQFDLPVVPDLVLAQIKSIIQFPIVEELVLDDEEIRAYCIQPAMQEYYTKFPVFKEAQYSITGHIEVAFPTPETFGVADARIVNRSGGAGSAGRSQFWNIISYQSMNGNYRGLKSGTLGGGNYGTRFNFNGLSQQAWGSRQTFDSIMNTTSSYTKIDPYERKVKAYSEVGASLYIKWAMWSLNFADVRYSYQQDVIKLAQASLAEYLARSAEIMSNTNIENQVNADALKTKAGELREDVLTRWRETPNIVSFRPA